MGSRHTIEHIVYKKDWDDFVKLFKYDKEKYSKKKRQYYREITRKDKQHKSRKNSPYHGDIIAQEYYSSNFGFFALPLLDFPRFGAGLLFARMLDILRNINRPMMYTTNAAMR